MFHFLWRRRFGLLTGSLGFVLLALALTALMPFFGDQVPKLLQPLAVDHVVLMRTPDRLLAIDFESGKHLHLSFG